MSVEGLHNSIGVTTANVEIDAPATRTTLIAAAAGVTVVIRGFVISSDIATDITLEAVTVGGLYSTIFIPIRVPDRGIGVISDIRLALPTGSGLVASTTGAGAIDIHVICTKQ